LNVPPPLEVNLTLPPRRPCSVESNLIFERSMELELIV
jgi:hypothetical protein